MKDVHNLAAKSKINKHDYKELVAEMNKIHGIVYNALILMKLFQFPCIIHVCNVLFYMLLKFSV